MSPNLSRNVTYSLMLGFVALNLGHSIVRTRVWYRSLQQRAPRRPKAE